MTFALEPALPLGAEVRRVACERLDLAIGELTALTDGSDTEVEAAIHSARKRCKEVRALAQLAREPLGRDFDTFDDLVRRAAHELSKLRDVHAMLATLTDLTTAANDPDLTAVHEIHAGLADEESERLRRDHATIEAAQAKLVEARERCASWKLGSSDWLTSGVAETYRSGRRALALARKHPTDGRMHKWRTHAKRFWYQMRLVEAGSPGVLGPFIARLDDLGETLGEHHDLSVLVKRLEATAKQYGGKKRVKGAVKRARARQHELAERAFRLGASLYAERTPAFTARIMHYWMMTRQLGPEPVPVGIVTLMADERREAQRARSGTETSAEPIERERKFLVERLPHLPEAGVDLRQGYLAIDGTVSLRVRDAGPDGYTLTVKGGRGAVRTELEWALTSEEFERAWTHTENRRLSKTRYDVTLEAEVSAAGKHTVEVDVFHGELEGLIIAEVEFDCEPTMQAFSPPDWFGREVTDDPTYTNASLATRIGRGRLAAADRSATHNRPGV